MFYSHSFLSSRGTLGAIWVAAYCFKKLKKAQVTQIDISSSVDKILHDEFDVVTYRVLAYLLLGVVRIFSKKVEYLFDDCNKVLLKIKEFVVSNKDMAIVDTLRAPYFSITLPERFELDAFDLEILEDASGGNMMPYEDITLKDGMQKTGAIVPYSLDKYQDEKFPACLDIFPTDYALNEDLSSCLEIVPIVDEEAIVPIQSSCEDCQNKADHLRTQEVVDLDEMHAEPSMQEVWENSIYEEACLNLEIFREVVEEPVNTAKSFVEHYQTDGQQIEIPNMTQPENENHEVIEEGCNLINFEASMEKLRENMVTQEDRDIEVFCMVEEPPVHTKSIGEENQNNMEHGKLLEVEEPLENTRSFDKVHQSSAEQKTLFDMISPGNSIYQDSKEGQTLSLTLDTTSQSKLPGVFSGATALETLTIPTPAAKEGARVPRKRKCIFDDMIVFPNNVIKECIEDPSDLVSKRRKAPHTALAAWRVSRVSSLSRSFLEPLIPCTSSTLRSLFHGKKLKVSDSLDTVKLPQTLTSEGPAAGKSIETVKCLEKLDKSKSSPDCRSVETIESLEKLSVSASPGVSRLVETVEPPEISHTPESPTAGRSFEQTAIAPETPVLHTKALRSFESPERPEISNLDRVGLEAEGVEKELSPSKEHEIDLNMMNEEISSCGADSQNHYGWSERTRVAMRCLQRSFLNEKKRREEEVVNLLCLLEGRTKKESARLFNEILVLKSKGYVHVKQENAYGDILIWKASQWGQACVEDSVEAARLSMYSES